MYYPRYGANCGDRNKVFITPKNICCSRKLCTEQIPFLRPVMDTSLREEAQVVAHKHSHPLTHSTVLVVYLLETIWFPLVIAPGSIVISLMLRFTVWLDKDVCGVLSVLGIPKTHVTMFTVHGLIKVLPNALHIYFITFQDEPRILLHRRLVLLLGSNTPIQSSCFPKFCS